jgi:formate/nitrite transporter
MEARTPTEILAFTSDVGIAKIRRRIPSLLILSFLAGAFVAFASEGSNMAAYNLLDKAETYGLGRVLAGAVFGTALMLIICAGGELFTGNTLIIVTVLDRKVTVRQMLMNWLLVYIGNFIGSICIVWMMYQTGLFNSSGGLLGGMTIKIAANKTSLSFLSVFLLGIMCNWLVCLAIWVSFGAREIAGKILAIFFIILLFVISGFEHSVANMYYIPAGILAKQNPQWLAMSQVPVDQLAGLTWVNFFVKNLIPVTLGNIVGGAGMVGTLYWLSLGKRKKEAE